MTKWTLSRARTALKAVTGTYLIFSRYPVKLPEVDAKAKWASGVTGIHVRFPKSETLNKKSVMRVLSEALGETEWQEVRGPNSMTLR